MLMSGSGSSSSTSTDIRSEPHSSSSSSSSTLALTSIPVPPTASSTAMSSSTSPSSLSTTTSTTTVDPAVPVTTAPFSCPLAQTTYSLPLDQRQRILVDYDSIIVGNYSSSQACSLTFTCASANSSGLMFKVTKSVPTGKTLVVKLTAKTAASGTFAGSVSVPLGGELGFVVNTNIYTVTVDTNGDGGAFAVEANCVPTSMHVPQHYSKVNREVAATLNPSSSSISIKTYSSQWTTFTITPLTRPSTQQQHRRSYGVNENRSAFLISCPTSDVVTENKIVQIESITGAT